MATIPYCRADEADPRACEIYADIVRTYGSPEPHGIYLLMGRTSAFLAASWPRSRYLFGTRTSLSLREKHLVTLAVSAANSCSYCVGIHSSRLLGLGLETADLAELMAVVDATAGAAKFAEGAQPEGALRPDLAAANLARKRLVFDEDHRLGRRVRHMAAFGVAAALGSDALVERHAGALRELGFSDNEAVELLFVVDLTTGYNRYVQGLQADHEEKPFNRPPIDGTS